jgi:hypothetical protein
LDQILAVIAAPPLDYVHIGFIKSNIFDISQISQWIGRTEMLNAFAQVYMFFGNAYFNVMLSSRKGATGGKMLRLSLTWIDSGGLPFLATTTSAAKILPRKVVASIGNSHYHLSLIAHNPNPLHTSAAKQAC